MRFLMIGGFLGAGKTTAIGRLAKHYTDQGLRVGVVTNDQAFGLVDTMSLQAQGFDVGEVPGACFCCKFNDLVETIDRLKSDTAPDLVITEPVGSCTDLAATVIEPLRQFHEGEFQIAPLAVLIKPEHGLKILRNDPKSGFSPKAAYIFLKQIEEAEVLVVNKVDKLTAEVQKELAELVAERYPDKPLIFASAKIGSGFDELCEHLSNDSKARTEFMEVDYDVYAEGEAELGWLNAEAQLTSSKGDKFSIDSYAVNLLKSIQLMLNQNDAEPAHLKVLCQNQSEAAIANLVGSDVDVELSTASQAQVSDAEVVVNARATIAPELLESIVRESISNVAEQFGAQVEVGRLQRFRPGRPVPTHRMT